MNHSFQLLQTLYSSAFGKYTKFRHRFDRAIQSGKFKKLSKRKQSSLISRLRKLYERLKSLHTQLRLAGAGAGLVLTLALSSPAQAQNSIGPFVRDEAVNPFLPPIFFDEPRPAAVDIDDDGDLDIFVGTLTGEIKFFRNDSPPGLVKRFTEVTGTSNPFNGVNKGNHAVPAFADVDGDGDYDMLLGINYPQLDPPGGPTQFDYSPTFFFRNTGTQTSPVFTEQTGVSNPFNGIYGTKYGPAIPVFVDLDGDSDSNSAPDLFMGGSYSSDVYGPNPAVQFFENNGSGIFTPTANSLSTALAYLSNVAVSFADTDDDGDLDALVGTYADEVRFFVQTAGTFTEVTGSQNPFYSFNVFNRFNNRVFPVTADMDGDGDLDFLVGNEQYDSWQLYFSNLRYFENTDGNFTLADRTDLNTSPTGGVDVGGKAAPVFTDLDNDGDLDAVIGSKYSAPPLSVYINNEGEFTADQDHPIVAISGTGPGFTRNTIPAFADIDNDSDKDLFLCRGGDILFFRNDNGNFTLETDLFPSLKYAIHSIAFIDVDHDNDLDALVGDNYSGQHSIVYFENTGTASSPEFSETTAPAPFENHEFENEIRIVGADLDYDGDTDVVVTETYYNGFYGDSDASRTLFFENTGHETFTEASFPLIIENTPRSLTSFMDFDGDGDLDAFLGNGASFDLDQDGRVFYFENTGAIPETGLTVYNAVSPNSGDDLNSYMRIEGLSSASNKVTIFNRWGDKVFEISQYDNNTRRFEGKNDKGKDLPSGTYFYTIDVSGKTHAGYLSLKR